MANDDLISRQTAIDALGEEPLVWNEDDAGEVAERNQWKRDVAAIKSLPSAERRGRWIEKRNVAFPHLLCSECKKPFYGSRFDVWNYCPNCGAKMEATE